MMLILQLQSVASFHVKGEQEIVGAPWSLLGDSGLATNYADKGCSAKTKQLSQGLNDSAADRAQPMTQDRSCVLPDGWISERAVPSPTLFPTPPSWLREIAPAVNIEPFDGDPLKWNMFITSFNFLVHDVAGTNAQRLAILHQLLYYL
ncbi:hypothetical protein TTRE_0000379901 [Trichuris trichiura]|uniref:Uncharacterized protein n=1 Tax=Trichuris trichiura TaxID=36087 RepID=A0A077Z4V3_TRITR|nr:hypothetical protein TTRE_0000379901 [Trichuris trichiura]